MKNLKTQEAESAIPLQVVSDDVLKEKYCKGDESSMVDVLSRVAGALAQAEDKECEHLTQTYFWQALQDGFIPAGRVLSAAGVDLKATLINCFVQPVGDAMAGLDSGVPGIFTALEQSAETLRRGGGVGYDFSQIRPASAFVKGTKSRASGPLSFMRVFDETCKQIESAGARRGAQMGVLRVDHPDIVSFVKAKEEPGAYTQFNLSVAVTEEFLQAVSTGTSFELVHKEAPYDRENAFQREDGLWIYEEIDAKELWDLIIHQTYDHAEPGVLFVDQANRENNLWYCETFEATIPRAEQWLPNYGCCCLGSVNLTKFVDNPFTDEATFNYERFALNVEAGIHMLDNVLDVTAWPLEEQRLEADSKRRVGLGFTGLGNALAMLNIRYNSPQGLDTASRISEVMRDSAYRSSVNLAKKKGAFPLFDADKYCDSEFVKRLPQSLQNDIREHGIRNSHLLSIAPTGTISLAMADNASNGIEPPFSFAYQRKKRMTNGTHQQYPVVDHGFRRYCMEVKGVDPAFAGEAEIDELLGDLPESFVSALEMDAQEHLDMLAAVQPYIDSSISKTVNIPADYPFEEFQDLYTKAADAGLKGLATYRPNDTTGAVLSVGPTNGVSTDQDDPDRRLRVESLPEPVMESLRWPKRPTYEGGNPSWTQMVRTPDYNFALFVGLTPTDNPVPFEVWVNGNEQPRGLGAIAKAISMDMRSNDRTWLLHKLESLEKAKGDDGFALRMPPNGEEVTVPSLVSGFAKIVKHYVLQHEGEPSSPDDLLGSRTPMMDALMSIKEPKTGAEGTMSWSVDVSNTNTGDDFMLTVKELQMPDGEGRPYSVWISGEYPRVFDGLCKVLSYDMRIIDPAWIGAKLRSLRDFSEPQGDFWAKAPGLDKQQVYPSTVAYVCELLIHRYHMLGILDGDGFPLRNAGLMEQDYHNVVALERRSIEQTRIIGKTCPECNASAVIKKDGCDYCTACGAIGSCG